MSSRIDLQYLIILNIGRYLKDDKDIINFLLNEHKYHGQEMDYCHLVETIDGKETIFGQEVIQLKTKKVPKGLVILEKTFNNEDRVRHGAKHCKP